MGTAFLVLLLVVVIVYLAVIQGDLRSGLRRLEDDVRSLRQDWRTHQKQVAASQFKADTASPNVADEPIEVGDVIEEPEEPLPRPLPPMPHPTIRPVANLPTRERVASAHASPRASSPAHVPSRFETAARETLQKIWNWIIVGRFGR